MFLELQISILELFLNSFLSLTELSIICKTRFSAIGVNYQLFAFSLLGLQLRIFWNSTASTDQNAGEKRSRNKR